MKIVKRKLLILSSFLILSLLFNFFLLYQKSELNRVIRVVDGDSFDLKDGRRIRLLSLDAPEKNRCYYVQSRDYLKSLILNNKIYLKDTITDDYGRIIGNIFVGNILINKKVLEEGNARFTYNKSPYYDELKRAFESAKNLEKGVYSPICRTQSTDSDCQIKGNNNHGEKFYFTPECRNYFQVIIDESFGEKWFCTEEEAQIQGFKKSSIC